jgi:hypothetical protein
LIILIVLPIWVYSRRLKLWIASWIAGRKTSVDVQLLLCPLCGQTADRHTPFCHSANMDNAPIIRLTGNGAGRNSVSALRLSDIGNNPKLASVKDQMIRQCADIIKRLAENDT